MAEQYFAPDQTNVGWGLTLKMAGKHPAVAERIWNTYSDALEYVNDFAGTATDGLILSILKDSVVDGVTYKAGAYFVKKSATAEGANDGELMPTGMSEADLTALIDSKIEGAVASGEFTFGLNADTMQIVLALNGDVIGSVDASDFVLDGILDDVALAEADGSGNAGTFMKFTFNAASGKTPIYLNVEKLIDIYELDAGEVTGGTYVTPTLTISGSGTSSDPWKVNLSINDSALSQELTELSDALNLYDSALGDVRTDLETLQKQVEGIVNEGGEANTIVKITLNGVELVPNADRVVNIPLASSTAAGAMSATQCAKLDGITAITDDEIDAILAG